MDAYSYLIPDTGEEQAAPVPSQAVVPAAKAAPVTRREPMSRQQAVALSQERRNAGRKPRLGSEAIDPMDPVCNILLILSLVQALAC